MEFLTSDTFRILSNPGVTSTQLLAPYNSRSERVTLTRVMVSPGAIQKRHAHPASEQIWVAIAGHGELLIEGGRTQAIQAGDVVRFGDGEVHGFHNDSTDDFVYLSVTTPPIDFSYAYKQEGQP
jgi:quercetin dioxygenase-like cupin family protein